MRSQFVLLASFAAAPGMWGQTGSEPLSPAEQQALIAKIPFTALRFRGQLPDFTALEQETRWVDPSGAGRWKKRDTLLMLISFTPDGRTGVKLLKVDGKPAKRAYDQEAGAKDPEFLHGAILPTHLFGPKAETQFEWVRWDTLDGRRVAVFSFRAKPVFELQVQPGQIVRLGFHGLVYADPSNAAVMRLETMTDAPPGYPFEESGWDVDYGVVSLSGRELLLPVRAVTHYRRGQARWKNEIQLSGYRKYEADSTVTFDK